MAVSYTHLDVYKRQDEGIRTLSVVASVNLARRLERTGVDALIAEGMECGGHIGDIATMPLVPQICLLYTSRCV